MPKKMPKEHLVPKLGVGETISITEGAEKLRLVRDPAVCDIYFSVDAFSADR